MKDRDARTPTTAERAEECAVLLKKLQPFVFFFFLFPVFRKC